MTDMLACYAPLRDFFERFWRARPKKTRADHEEFERQYRALVDWLILKEEYAARRGA